MEVNNLYMENIMGNELQVGCYYVYETKTYVMLCLVEKHVVETDELQSIIQDIHVLWSVDGQREPELLNWIYSPLTVSFKFTEKIDKDNLNKYAEYIL